MDTPRVTGTSRATGTPAGDEPVAIVGLSCRLPGAADPDAFWRLLCAEECAVTQVPAGREPAGGRWGAFLDDVDRFDAEFFGITPREAAVLDPQQRLMLELAWEAFENARMSADELRGSATGVFLGAMRDDYALLLGRAGRSAVNHHAMPGVSRGVIANRVSHFLGLRGPSLVVDAGQASSLVAVHTAVESLRRGESTLALAGGVNLNLAAETGLAAEEFGGLSPDGRSYAFDHRANGFVRGEGGVALVLRPLSDAVLAGDRVYGVILGGAVNNDGGTEQLTTPSARAQEEVLRQAYKAARVPLASVQYVELHGTGTPVGDPVEASALGAVLGAARDAASPLLVGSVKTNLGHLEAAAGAAGLLKTVLALSHRRIPASLNFERPNPGIALEELNLRVASRTTEWPACDGPRIAGVSAFGMGGTNCHLVLSEAPAEAPEHVSGASREAGASAAAPGASAVAPGVVPWVVSGRSAAALRGQAAALLPLAGGADPVAVGWSLVSSRARFEHRAVVVGDQRAGLSALAGGEPAAGVVSGSVSVPVGRTVFVFPGQGAQWAGMAVELLEQSPVFAARLAQCQAALSEFVDWSLTDVLRGVSGAPSLERVEVVQPASFAVMVSLAALWRSYGVEPAAVVGHSQGEIAAACVAGALSLQDAARVVCLRSQAIARLAGSGTMASVAAPVDEVVPLLRPGVSVAAVNGPSQVVVSGDVAGVEALLADCAGRGVRARRIPVDYASHSAHVEEVLDELAALLAPVEPRRPQVPFWSTVTGEWVDTPALDAAYWCANLRRPVRFAEAIEALAGQGFGVFVESSPHPVLTTAIEETVTDREGAFAVGSLRRDDGGLERFLLSLAEAWVRGVEVDWTAHFPAETRHTVDLPTYAFQRRRHWFDTVAPEHTGDGTASAAAGRLAAARSEDERRRILLELVRGHAAAVLGHTGVEAIPARTSFKDLGFDSQSSVRMRDRLCEALGVGLPSGLLFDHPTPAGLAEHLLGLLSGGPKTQETAVTAGRPSQEPIAIVGMGCRFPGGVRSPEELWELLRTGTDAVAPFPTDRGWDLEQLFADPDAPGGSVVGEGGFLYDAGDFDADFFGISPREALAMDPQQRLLLETAWEALERAGIDPSGLGGSRTGVFVGAMQQEYGPRLHEASDGFEGYALTGTTGSTASGRISYVLGLEGPTMTVDTACSASLVALHLAVQSLRSGECSLALAGAATVMSRPGIFVEFSRQRGLAPDGRCKAFSDDADGTGWAEGAGILVLERLSDARRNGHRILAVVEGSAVNSDGASNGLTAPSGPAQQRVIRQALSAAGLRPDDVDAVEAHGTGTVLGDPIEATALIEVYGRGRSPERPLWLGSLKSNIGHAQAAAGLGGVMKMVLALRHGLLPKTLHVGTPSSRVDWSAGEVRLLTEPVPWTAGGRVRRAGISAFGVGGTNAHVIIAEPAEEAEEAGGTSRRAPGTAVLPYVLSARTPAALRAQAGQLRGALRGGAATSLTDVARTLATGRARFAERAVVLAGGPEELERGLEALAGDDEDAGLVRGTPAGDDRVVFVFPGQGGQWAGMATELLQSSPVFAARIAECGRALSEFVDWSLTDVLRGAEGAPPLDRADVVQPALWATMVSLAALWESRGIRPAAVIGHSQGEIAAACVAGALTLRDAARVVALRSRVLLALSGTGTMASVFQPADQVAELVERFGGRISVAASNSPRSVVVAGETAAVEELLAECARLHIHARAVPVDYASHSPQVEPVEAELLRLLAPVEPRPAEVPFHSTVTGTRLEGTELTGDYWYRNLRSTVRFEEVVRELAASGHRIFLEASPHPTLTIAVEQTLESVGAGDGVAVGSLRRGDGGEDRLGKSLARLWVNGVEPDWAEVFAGLGGRPAELPTYPFQRQRYWWTPSAPTAPAPAKDEHPVARWRYDVVWRPVPDTPAVAGPAGSWLVITDTEPAGAGEDGAEVVRALREAGADVTVCVLPGGEADGGTLAGLAPGRRIAGVVSLLSLRAGDDPAGQVATTATLLRSLDEAGLTAPLWVITRGAVSVGPSDPAPDPARAAVWGAGRAAAVEQPLAWGGLVDLPAGWDRRTRDRLAAVLTGTGPEDQVALRPAGRFVRRLVPARRPTTAPRAYRPRGSVLVTGGTGALGRRLARRLAEDGAEHVILLSRRGQDAADTNDLADELAAFGTELTISAVDVTDRAALAALLERIPPDRPLTAVFHAAGVCELGLLKDVRTEDLPALLAAKTTGAHHLDELLQDTELDAFVLFSSVSATWGVAEHGAYGAANAYLDALAERRRGRGLTATSIAWGPWGGGGMIDESRWETLAATGLPVLAPDRALEALRLVLDHDETAVVVADVDWDRFGPVFTAVRPSPLLGELVAAQPEPARSGPDGAPGLQERLHRLPEDAQRELVLDLVREHTAKVLGHSEPKALAADRAFKELGFDSLTAVELRNRLATATGTRLPTALVFDHPTPDLLAEHLWREICGNRPAEDEPETGRTASREPLAVVGMACRLPGAVSDPEALWRLLMDEEDAIGALPADRGWDLGSLYDPDPDRHGTSYVRSGGFLHHASEFDHEFFGISPREALATDPQQRLLLEAAWEAFENAGIVPADLKGSDTGVFTGVLAPDYGLPHGMPGELEGYHVTGGAPSVASGRLAYTFGFTGPAITVDTACSSSLVALHMAARALEAGECGLALVAGAAVMSTPTPLISFSRQRALSADGRCRSFSEDADGFGMAEGVGVLLVERLSDARRNGHRVLAVIRGSAVNQDGASNGLTAPNGPSQQRVIRQALANAGLTPQDVDAVEAHGTGTTLGDPIEAEALLATYGQDRPQDRPLWLGSVKSNIGHTQAAAGIVGVIKMVQALCHEVLPRTLHVREPSSRIDWSAGAVELLTEARPWPRGDRPRRAGVSAFGISGTNAHVILEEAPAGEAPEHVPGAAGEPSGAVPWILSARNLDALRDRAAELLPLAGGADPVAVGWSLVSSRARFEHRAVVVGDQRAGLSALAGGEPAAGVVSGSVSVPVGRTVFVFPGQGAQWAGMAVELLEQSPVFAARLAQCQAALSEFVDWSLTDVLRGVSGAPSLERVEVVQPASFAVMVSLAALWRSYGVEPAAVVGHSQGEIAAACVAGALSLQDAARVVCLRSQAIARLAGSGTMASVAAPVDEVVPLLRPGVSVAAVNGPSQVVVSGDVAGVEALLADCAGRGVRARRIAVDYASHSAHVEEVLDELAALLAPVEPRRPQVPFWSTVTGEWVDTPALDAAYWCANLRRPVRFAEAIEALAGQGFGVFVESSPHPVLTTAIEETVTDREGAFAVGSLRRDDGGLERFLLSLAEAWVRGVEVDWTAHFPAETRHTVDLPTYPFRRYRHWLETPAATAARQEAAAVDGWRHRVVWRPVPPTGTPELTGDWIVVTPDPAVRPDLVRAVLDGLTRHGATAHPLTVRQLTEPETLRLPERVDGILSLAALDERPDRDEPEITAGLADTVTCVQVLGPRAADAPLWLATRGAVGTGPDDPVAHPLQAQVWGLGLVLGLDEPGRLCGRVDLPDHLDEAAVSRLCESLSGITGEHEVAVRGSTAFARRLVPDPAPGAEPWRPRGTVLITGGTGALGAHVARWAARNGAAHLLLTSRRGENAPGADVLREELTALGARVTIAACDVADAEQLAAVLAKTDAAEPLTAVVHAAGVTQPEIPVGDLTTAELARIIRVKAQGARHLDALTAGLDLDAFVLFSSGAGTWGDAGKAAYAAANAYLDAFAQERRARGEVATSIAWGAWDGGGMAEGDVADLLTRRGMRLMRPESAVRALTLAVGHGDTAVAIASFDLARFLPLYTMARSRPLVAELTAPPEAAWPGPAEDIGSGSGQGPSTTLADRLAGLCDEERESALSDLVRREAAAVLKAGRPEDVQPRRAFKELGFDSLTALEFRNRLNVATGLKLPATLVFDHPTPAALVRHLSSELSGGADGVLAELDRLEAGLAALPDEEWLRLDLATRLRGLLRRAETTAEPADPPQDLESATNDEIFDLIDRELGIR